MMPISHALQLDRRAVVELNQAAEENIEILANKRPLATGKVVNLDGRLGVSINQVVRLPDSLTS